MNRGQRPSFSVVVPTYRRPDQLSRCLDALADLDYPRDRLEIVVVDDGGGMVEPALQGSRDGLDISLVQAPHAGPAAARNLGVARASGQFVAFTDDDCLPCRGWLQALADRLAEAPDRAVGGCTVNAFPHLTCAEASHLILESVYAHYNRRGNGARFFASNNMAMAVAVFRAVGGFDSDFPTSGGEDRDLCDRLLRQGYPLVSVPQAVVRHAHALDLSGFWRQYVAYGRGAWYFHIKRIRRGSSDGPGDLGVHAAVARAALRRRREMAAARWVTLVALLAVWEVANAAGVAREALRGRRQRRPPDQLSAGTASGTRR